jgi:hypothetical protein
LSATSMVMVVMFNAEHGDQKLHTVIIESLLTN